jgi:hypothetical protein
VWIVPILDAPSLADRTQVDAIRQSSVARRPAIGELAASVFDPLPVLEYECRHFR